jgi:hypothetical protein
MGEQARCAGRLQGVCGLCEVSFLHMELGRAEAAAKFCAGQGRARASA